MFTDARDLIDDTLDKLEALSDVLAEEVDGRRVSSVVLTSEARTCKEALQTIKILIPKLQQARATQIPDSQLRLPECVNCD